MTKRAYLLAAAIFAISVVPAAAGVITYTDRAAFEAAVGGAPLTTDPFDNEIDNGGGGTITFDSGVISTNVGGIPCCDDNTVLAGNYFNGVDGDGNDASVSIEWNFTTSVFAVGFDVFEVNDNGVQVSIDDGSGEANWLLFDVIGGNSRFVGFVSDQDFTTLTFTDTSDALDLFNIDNLAFASGSRNTVPEPATLALFGLGLAGFGLARRRKSKA